MYTVFSICSFLWLTLCSGHELDDFDEGEGLVGLRLRRECFTAQGTHDEICFEVHVRHLSLAWLADKTPCQWEISVLNVDKNTSSLPVNDLWLLHSGLKGRSLLARQVVIQVVVHFSVLQTERG